MPRYFAAGICANLVVCDLSASTTTNISKKKDEISKAATETAISAFESGRVIKESDLDGQDGKQPLIFLADKPFIMVKAGLDLFCEAESRHGILRKDLHHHPIVVPIHGAVNGAVESRTLEPTGRRPKAKKRSEDTSGQRVLEDSLAPVESFASLSATHGSNAYGPLDEVLKPIPHALGLRIKVSSRTFLRTLDSAQSPQDIKINVYLNGFFTESIMIHARESKCAERRSFYFTGRRIAFLMERPWVIVPPGQQADGSLRGLKRGKPGERDGPAERWDKIGVVLLNEADRMGVDTEGKRPPVGAYLKALGELPAPHGIQDLLRHGRAKFGVIDVVISVGVGVKRTGNNPYIIAPTLFKDEAYQLANVSTNVTRKSEEAIRLASTRYKDLDDPKTPHISQVKDANENATTPSLSSVYKENLTTMKRLKLTTKGPSDRQRFTDGQKRRFSTNIIQEALSDRVGWISPQIPIGNNLSGLHSDSLYIQSAKRPGERYAFSSNRNVSYSVSNNAFRNLLAENCANQGPTAVRSEDLAKPLASNSQNIEAKSVKKRQRRLRPSDGVLTLSNLQEHKGHGDHDGISHRGVFVSAKSPTAIRTTKHHGYENGFEIFETPPSRIHPAQTSSGTFVSRIVITLRDRKVRQLELPVPRRLFDQARPFSHLQFGSFRFDKEKDGSVREPNTAADVLEHDDVQQINFDNPLSHMSPSNMHSKINPQSPSPIPRGTSPRGTNEHTSSCTMDALVSSPLQTFQNAPDPNQHDGKGDCVAGGFQVASRRTRPHRAAREIGRSVDNSATSGSTFAREGDSDFESRRSHKKQRTYAKRSRKPSYVIQSEPTMDVPELCRDCVITYAEPRPGEEVKLGPGGVVRQVKCQRPGDFRESDVVLGIRFVVMT